MNYYQVNSAKISQMTTYTKPEAKQEIAKLIKKFDDLTPAQRKNYNEANTRKDFILPLFHALNWDVYNSQSSNEVIEEEATIAGRIDYSFRLHNLTQFLLEAKSIPVGLNKDQWAKQAIEYGWNKGISWVVLTDFEDLKIFSSDWKRPSPQANLTFNYKEYLTRFEDLWLLSRESVEKGELNAQAQKWGITAKRVNVSEVLAQDLVEWREMLTKNFKAWNPKVTISDLDEAVQRILDRLIFIRVVEDRNIEEKTLWQTYQKWTNSSQSDNFIQYLIPLFREYDKKYNSNLFAEHLCEKLDTEGEPFTKIIPRLYGEKEVGIKYRFDAINADVLGGVYEQYLGKVQEREGSISKRKNQGIYYTPNYIVDYIVQNTLGELLKETPGLADREKIKILDPACGSGSFLLKAFELMDENLRKDRPDPALRKSRILTENIYGIDLDEQAIEIARLNLLLKALVPDQKLPMLTEHMKVGNSLIDDPKVDKKAFNWPEEFKNVFSQKNPGFDIIIGNPPYGANIEDKQKKYFFNKNKLSEYQLDTYILFIELSLNILKSSGFLGLIIPNTWLMNIKFNKLRAFLLEKTTIFEIINYSSKIFKGATVDNVVLILRKTLPGKSSGIKITLNSQNDFKQHVINQLNILSDKAFNIQLDNDQKKIIKKIETNSFPLSEICLVSVGIKPYQIGKGKPKQTDKIVTERVFDSTERKDESYRLYLRGRDINRFCIAPNKNQFLSYGQWLAEPRNLSLFDVHEKIFVRQTGDSIVAAIDNYGYLCLNNMHVINLLDKKFSLRFILGLLNSKLFDFYYCYLNPEKGEALAEVKATNVKRLQIKNVNSLKQNKITSFVNEVMALKKSLIKTTEDTDKSIKIMDEIQKLERQIDNEVYKLYGLTPEEIKIVEESSK